MQSPTNSSITISRYFSEPPQKVWQAWIDPQMVKLWFGSDPKGKVLDASLDVRLDGAFEVTFRNSDETQHTCTGKYKEIEPYQKLIFTWAWKGRSEIIELVIVLFQAERNGTLMSFEHANIDSNTTHNYEIGWKSTFDKLERALKINRTAWLKEMQRDCEARYDRDAPLYGEKYGLYSNITHQQFLQEFLSLLPPKSMLLDAACGAGRYVPFLLEQEHSILGIDQSQGMLARAQAKFPGVQFAKVGLQEMAYQERFDGVICMDAMENICPEDWALVLNNFYRALKPDGYLYFTVETIENADAQEIQQALERAQEADLPVIYGECPDEEVYHYHPTNQQVREWTQQAGFEILREENGELWYYHILVRKISVH